MFDLLAVLEISVRFVPNFDSLAAFRTSSRPASGLDSSGALRALPPAFAGLRSHSGLPSLLPTCVGSRLFRRCLEISLRLSPVFDSLDSLAAFRISSRLASGLDSSGCASESLSGFRRVFNPSAPFRISFRLASALDSSSGALHLHPTFYGGHQLRRTLGAANLWTQVENL
jgi:hypothetical protein